MAMDVNRMRFRTLKTKENRAKGELEKLLDEAGQSHNIQLWRAIKKWATANNDLTEFLKLANSRGWLE